MSDGLIGSGRDFNVGVGIGYLFFILPIGYHHDPLIFFVRDNIKSLS